MKALLEKIRKILRDRRTRKFLTRLVSGVAAVVVFITTYALVLPAITMESQAACGIEAHQHDDSCYTEELICGQEESEGHHHTEDCYTVTKDLVCSLEEHQHSAENGCYDEDGNLICKLEEHTHTDSCYEEHRELTCGLEETDGHTHTDSCYKKVLTCGKPVHTHSATCYKADPELQSAGVASTGMTSAAATSDYSEEEYAQEESLDESIGSQAFDEPEEIGSEDQNPGKEIIDEDSSSAETEDNQDADIKDENADKEISDEVISRAEPENDPVTDLENENADDNSVAAESDDMNRNDDSESKDEKDEKADAFETGDTAFEESADEENLNTEDDENVENFDREGEESASSFSTGFAAEEDEDSYIPEKEALDFNTVLNNKTGIYYHHLEAGETVEDSSAITDWIRVDEDTELSPEDLIRVYLGYTLPADAINATNDIARYRLPDTLHLTDEQIDAINKCENGISSQYVDYSKLEITDIERHAAYLGLESVEGTRTPDEELKEDSQEYISATVKAEKIYDEDNGEYKGTDLIFTFSPYTVEKNAHAYDKEGQPTKAGEKVKGWLMLDFNLGQVDWAEDRTSEIVFAKEDEENYISEIRTVLRQANPSEVEADDSAADGMTEAAAEYATEEIASEYATEEIAAEDMTAETSSTYATAEVANSNATGEAAAVDSTGEKAGESSTDDATTETAKNLSDDKTAQEKQTAASYPAAVFDDSITVRSGRLDTDLADTDLPRKTKMTVHVEADEGTFPEGTKMVLSPVDDLDAVAEAVGTAVDAKTRGFQAVDITFYDKDPSEEDAKEIEPLNPIRVSIKSDEIRKAAEDSSTAPVVVHIEDDNTATAIENTASETDSGTIEIEKPATDPENTSDPAIQSDDNLDNESENNTASQESNSPTASSVEDKDKSADNISENEDNADKASIGGTVDFEADSFSVYAIVYTVDFHWEVDGKTYDFSLPGGGFVSFTDLIEVLGISDGTNTNDSASENNENNVLAAPLSLDDVVVSDATKEFVTNVAKVEFSTPELLSVSKAEEDTTVGTIKDALRLECEYSAELTEEQIDQINSTEVKTGDWALISLKAFDTEETLTVTMKNGEVFTIRVTDMQVNDPMGLHSQSFAIVNYKNWTNSALGATTNSGHIDSKTVNVDTKDGVKICDEDAAAWTFEYVEDGKYYIHYGEHYLKITGTNVSNWRVDIVPRDQAGIINVTEQDGKYRFTNDNNVALNNYGGNFWAYERNGETNNPNEWMELRKPMKASNPALVNTADTKSAGLTINLFDYGPDNNNSDSIDNVDHGNNNPSYVGINVNPADNSHRELLFFSYGNTTGNGINDFSGGRTAQQGILKTELDANNYPVLQSGSSLQYLFDDSEFTGKTVYSDVNHWFEQDSSGYYEYDSNKYYAYYDPNQGDEGTFKVYSDSHNEEGTKDNEKVGFFPFNEYSDCTCIHGYGSGFQNFTGHQSYNNGNLGHYNHHFGVNMSGEFYLPEDDTTTTADDVVFRFSGDDDMWVFIDGVLVLDIGGIHEQVSGEIDFTNDKITVSGAQTVTGGNGSALGTSSSLTAAFEKTQVEGGSNKTWDDSPFKSHRIDVFYFERGGMYSNCKISFNLPLISAKGKATVAKYDSSGNPAAPLEGVEFGLYSNPECSGDPLRTISSSSSGMIVFDDMAVLSTDQKYYLKEIKELPGYKKNSNIYTLELGEPDEHGVYQFIIKDSDGGTIETIGEEPAIPVIYNEPIEPIELSVEKQWEDVTGEPITPDNNYYAEFEVHRLKSYTRIVTEEGELEKSSTLRLGYYYTYDNVNYTYKQYENQTYSFVAGSKATISYNYDNDHNGNYGNNRNYKIEQSGEVKNINDSGSFEVTMPAEGKTLTVYFYDNFSDNSYWQGRGKDSAFTSLSATGRTPQHTQVEREEIHTDDPDDFECEHLILTNGETSGTFDSGLFEGTDDAGKFPVQETKDDGITYSYKYYITEVENSRRPADCETIYKDGEGNVITNPKTLATDESLEQVIVNRKLLNIPFEKYWDIDPDQEPNAYSWTATLQLLSRLIDVDSGDAITSFEPVEGKQLTVSSDHAGQGSFNGLPMYRTQNGTEYRIQYSVREIAYLVRQTSDNTIKYQWQDPEFYTNPVQTIGDKLFTLHYVQDAGENGDTIDDYSIIVNNTPDNREEKKSIDITLQKTWPGDVDLTDAFADFVLKRYVYEEYRNFPAGTTDWVEITLNTGSETKQKLRVPRNWDMFIFCHIKPNTNAENIQFEGVSPCSYDNSSENSEHLFAIPITADQTKEITLTDGAQYVVGGTEGFRLSDINDENDKEVKLDHGFEIPIHLDAENNWNTVLHRLPAIEEAELYSNETTAFTRYVYRYFLEEVGCSPENFDAVFKDTNGQILGDSNNKIDVTSTVIANNQKKTGTLKVTKDLLGNVTGNDDRYFNVTIKNSENKYLQSDRISFGDNPYTFHVSKSEPLEISGLPIGQYTVSEKTEEADVAIAGYLWNIEESTTEEEVEVAYNQLSTVELINYYDEIYTPSPSNMDVKENLTINKVWANLNDREPSEDDEVIVKINVESAEAYVPVRWDLYNGNSNEVNNRNPLSGIYYVEPGSDVAFTVSRAENANTPDKRIRLNSNVTLWNQDGSALQFTNRVPTNNQSQRGYAPSAASNTYTARDVGAETPVEFRLQPWKEEAVWVSNTPDEPGEWNMSVNVEQGKSYYSSVAEMRDALIDENATKETLVYSLKKGTAPQLVEELTTCNIRPDQVSGGNDGWTAFLNGLPTYERITEDHDGNTVYRFKTFKYSIEEIKVNGENVIDGKTDSYNIEYNPSTATGPTGRITTTTDITNTEMSVPIKVLKTDDQTNSTNYLPGAVFELRYRKTENDSWQKASKAEITQLDDLSQFTIPGDANGITLTGLKAGYYQLIEIIPPLGYVIVNDKPVMFEIKRGGVDNTTGTGSNVIYHPATTEETASPASFTIPNTPGSELPYTGGPGTRMFTILGSVLLAIAGILLIRRRRTI